VLRGPTKNSRALWAFLQPHSAFGICAPHAGGNLGHQFRRECPPAKFPRKVVLPWFWWKQPGNCVNGGRRWFTLKKGENPWGNPKGQIKNSPNVFGGFFWVTPKVLTTERPPLVFGFPEVFSSKSKVRGVEIKEGYPKLTFLNQPGGGFPKP